MYVAAVIADYHSVWDHLPAPDTPVGWATLLFVIALVIVLISRGLKSLSDTLETYFGFKSLLIFLLILVVLLFYAAA